MSVFYQISYRMGGYLLYGCHAKQKEGKTVATTQPTPNPWHGKIPTVYRLIPVRVFRFPRKDGPPSRYRTA